MISHTKQSKPSDKVIQRVVKGNDSVSYTTVGMRYSMGLEVEQSDSLALKYFAKICELDDANGCHYLTDMYAQGYVYKIRKS